MDSQKDATENLGSSRCSTASNLAFEDGFEGSPSELWRVESKRWLRPGRKEITHINWFATKEQAEKHADWINDGRGRVISIYRYCRFSN